jgi:hypothetical protein
VTKIHPKNNTKYRTGSKTCTLENAAVIREKEFDSIAWSLRVVTKMNEKFCKLEHTMGNTSNHLTFILNRSNHPTFILK